MTSSDTQVNGNGWVAVMLVVLFVVAVMGANGVINAMAWAWGQSW